MQEAVRSVANHWDCVRSPSSCLLILISALVTAGNALPVRHHHGVLGPRPRGSAHCPLRGWALQPDGTDGLWWHPQQQHGQRGQQNSCSRWGAPGQWREQKHSVTQQAKVLIVRNKRIWGKHSAHGGKKPHCFSDLVHKLFIRSVSSHTYSELWNQYFG